MKFKKLFSFLSLLFFFQLVSSCSFTTVVTSKVYLTGKSTCYYAKKTTNMDEQLNAASFVRTGADESYILFDYNGNFSYKITYLSGKISADFGSYYMDNIKAYFTLNDGTKIICNRQYYRLVEFPLSADSGFQDIVIAFINYGNPTSSSSQSFI